MRFACSTIAMIASSDILAARWTSNNCDCHPGTMAQADDLHHWTKGMAWIVSTDGLPNLRRGSRTRSPSAISPQ